MPGTITKDTTPAQIEQYADEYVELLKKSNLPADRDKIVGDMRKRAAGAASLTVEQWEAHHRSGAATSTPPPTPATPRPAKKKAATPPIKEEEPWEPEVPAAESKGKKERGVVREIDHGYFYIPDEVNASLRTWVDLNDAGIRMHMFAVGPAGCGKTSVFEVLGKKIDKPVYKVDCASITSADKWLGHKDVRITERGPETTYVLSQFLRWISADGFEPGIVVLDELTRLPGYLLNTLIPILDGSESVWVPELGISVRNDPKTLFAATANIGVGFTGTYGLDQALHDRFGATIEMTFPDPKEEQQILIKRTGVDDQQAKTLVEIGRQTRQKWDEQQLARPVSTRALLNAAHWVAAGRSIVDAAEATFVKHYSDEGKQQSERTIVRLLIKGLAGVA